MPIDPDAVELRLSPPPPPAAAPVLDASQQAVVDHSGGPLLVLAGPGTGKTTTIVELVVDRLVRGVLTPDQILVLTFGRAAATELRGRMAARAATAGLTATAEVPTFTFHGYCYGLVRTHASRDSFARPPTLLSAPEQDALVAELLAGHDPGSWPAVLRPALRTRGLAAEVVGLMAAVTRQGWGPADLARVAATQGRDDWARVAELMVEYDEICALRGLTDHHDLVAQAVDLLAVPDIRETVRARHRLVVVDEYQDTDPLQVELLRGLCGGDLVVVGDPDQAIYGFRGAEVRGISEFPEAFAQLDGRPAATLALGRTRRLPAAVLAASRVIAAPLGVIPGLGPGSTRALREVATDRPDTGDVDVRTYATPGAEAESIAVHLREAHLREGVPWSDMAVLVRTAADLSRLAAQLTQAGVPVALAGDEVPLAAQPAVRALLAGLDLAAAVAAGEAPDPEAAEAWLTGPLGGLDAPSLRRVGRALRRADAAARTDVGADTAPAPSRTLLAEALWQPLEFGHALLGAEPATRSALDLARASAQRLARAAAQVADGAPVEQVLWQLWDASAWSRDLTRAWESGADARVRADRDLDAICALFDHAAQTEEQRPHTSVRAFVDDLRHQEIPSSRQRPAVRVVPRVTVMTAHRSKGLEWPLVVVAGVQEGAWPNLRLRGSLLQAERLGPGGLLPAATGADRAREERRLFYVACTRASRELIVTAVRQGDDGDQPSRFVTELIAAGFGDTTVRPRPPRPLSLRAVVAELRQRAEVGEAAAVDLLVELVAAGRRATAAADPGRWWGLAPLTSSDVPVRDPEAPVRLSASAVDGLETCPLHWFLTREAGGATASGTAQGFGSLVHAVAADVVRRGTGADLSALLQVLDQGWSRMVFEAAWIGDRERAAAAEALGRFTRWHESSARQVVGAEVDFDCEVPVSTPNGPDTARLRGAMDRVELDAEGLVHVVDLKTGKGKPTREELLTHAQLGIYQLVVEAGGLADLVPEASSGGAELVQLRQSAGAATPMDPRVCAQPAPGPTWIAPEQLARSVATVRAEAFVARPERQACDRCAVRRACPARSGQVIGGSVVVADDEGSEA